jgi:hypothetical protein
MAEEKQRLRCKFGRHVSVTEGQVKPFVDFFGHCSAGGFSAYNAEHDKALDDMVRDRGSAQENKHEKGSVRVEEAVCGEVSQGCHAFSSRGAV